MAYLQMYNRCLIPECDSTMETVTYKPRWLNWTVPFDGEAPSKCWRYAANKSNNEDTNSGACHQLDFNRSSTVHCDEFVFESGGELTIVSAVCLKSVKLKLILG